MDAVLKPGCNASFYILVWQVVLLQKALCCLKQ